MKSPNLPSKVVDAYRKSCFGANESDGAVWSNDVDNETTVVIEPRVDFFEMTRLAQSTDVAAIAAEGPDERFPCRQSLVTADNVAAAVATNVMCYS